MAGDAMARAPVELLLSPALLISYRQQNIEQTWRQIFITTIIYYIFLFSLFGKQTAYNNTKT